MKLAAAYPTPQHEQAAGKIVQYFTGQPGISAVLLICSCARGKASADSCLDIAVLVSPDTFTHQRPALEQAWESFYQDETVFKQLLRVGKFSHVDLEFFDGHFSPAGYPHDYTSGPDEFELAVGNLLAYSVPLWTGDDTYVALKQRWLPYYEEDLRLERLAMVQQFFTNNLDHIPLFVKRGLYFQAFQRLYHAFGEFLQGLFISRRVYPIAYDKWVQEQVEEILELPGLYAELPQLLEILQFESEEIAQKAARLSGLWAENISIA